MPPIESGSSSLWNQVHRLVFWLRTALYSIAFVFFLILLGETASIYRSAANIHPYLGYLSILGMVIGAGLIAYPIHQFLRMPKVVTPPEIPPADQRKLEHLRAEVRYLDRYLANGLRNRELTDRWPEVRLARDDLASVAWRIRSATDGQVAELDKELRAWTSARMPALLHDVDKKAERVIYQEALAVGLATAASPNGTLDAFVMLWRSIKLVSDLAVIYYGRPGVWGTLLICRDVSVATAIAGYMQGVSDSLGNLVAKTAGGLSGVVAGPAVDGVTNALVLIRIGYLAQERCRSFRKWDTPTTRSALLKALSSTQRVAVGLSAEILRQAASKLGLVAGAAARGVAQAAGSAADTISSAAGTAVSAAISFGQTISSAFRSKIAARNSEELARQLPGHRPTED